MARCIDASTRDPQGPRVRPKGQSFRPPQGVRANDRRGAEVGGKNGDTRNQEKEEGAMTITLVRIEVQSKLVWQCLQAASGQWVAVCDTLKLTIQSDTFSELMEDIHQTLDAMFKDLLATGELDKFFRE